jgi:hypothetical protein
MSLPFHPEAVREAEKAVEWFERIGPDLAIDLTDALLEAEAQIEQAPMKYALAEDAPAGEEVRDFAVRRFPYRMLYWIGRMGRSFWRLPTSAASPATGTTEFPDV